MITSDFDNSPNTIKLYILKFNAKSLEIIKCFKFFPYKHHPIVSREIINKDHDVLSPTITSYSHQIHVEKLYRSYYGEMLILLWLFLLYLPN